MIQVLDALTIDLLKRPLTINDSQIAINVVLYYKLTTFSLLVIP
jgi:hypothetical protein